MSPEDFTLTNAHCTYLKNLHHHFHQLSSKLIEIIIYLKAVQEANAAIRVWMEEKEKRDQKSKAKVDRKPPPYKHLKVVTSFFSYRVG